MKNTENNRNEAEKSAYEVGNSGYPPAMTKGGRIMSWFKSKKIRILLGLSFYLLLFFTFNGTFLKLLAPGQIEDYMEAKYHREFKFVGWHNTVFGVSDEIALVRPVNEPNNVIMVDMYIGSYPWKAEYVDHCYTLAIREYLWEKAKELAVSKYATTVYTDVECNMYVDPKRQKEVERLYTLEEVKKGPTYAPKAYQNVSLFINFFGPNGDMEAMIEEQHQVFRRFTEEFDYNHTGLKLSVSDERLLKEDPKVKRRMDEGDYGILLAQLSSYRKEGRAWFFNNNKFYDEMPKCLSDFDSFKSFEKKYYPDY